MLLHFLLLRWCAKSQIVEGYSYSIKKDETDNLSEKNPLHENFNWILQIHVLEQFKI